MGLDGSFTGYLTFDAVTGAPILEAIDAAASHTHPGSHDSDGGCR